MALVVNSNIASLNAINNLNRTNGSLADTFGRISSGLRINKAADDAAGLAVAENLDAHTRSLAVAKRNANDGIGMVQVAEGATNEVAELLKRMRELAVQSSSETLASTERNYLVTEFDELKSEMDRIAVTTEFNGVGLTRGTSSGSSTNLSIQVGLNGTANDRIQIDLSDLQATALGLQATVVSTALMLRQPSTPSILPSTRLTANELRSVRPKIASIPPFGALTPIRRPSPPPVHKSGMPTSRTKQPRWPSSKLCNRLAPPSWHKPTTLTQEPCA